jgi:hypothetical protein
MSSPSCPRDTLGKPNCLIIAHPDHYDQHFCATCNKKFRDEKPKKSDYGRKLNCFDLVAIVFIGIVLLGVITENKHKDSQPITDTEKLQHNYVNPI